MIQCSRMIRRQTVDCDGEGKSSPRRGRLVPAGRKGAETMAEILEAVMLVCFGLSWPMNAYKNYKARTAAGASWQFILLITLGYVAGIAAKFASGNLNWVLAVYFVNLACVGVNWAVYLRNRRLDALRSLERAAASGI